MRVVQQRITLEPLIILAAARFQMFPSVHERDVPWRLQAADGHEIDRAETGKRVDGLPIPQWHAARGRIWTFSGDDQAAKLCGHLAAVAAKRCRVASSRRTLVRSIHLPKNSRSSTMSVAASPRAPIRRWVVLRKLRNSRRRCASR